MKYTDKLTIKKIPLHNSVRVYNSDNFVVNAVKHDDIKSHINYNVTYRFGCALFIDGVCVYSGYLQSQPERIKEWEDKLQADLKLKFKEEPDRKAGEPEPKYRKKFAQIPYQ